MHVSVCVHGMLCMHVAVRIQPPVFIHVSHLETGSHFAQKFHKQSSCLSSSRNSLVPNFYADVGALDYPSWELPCLALCGFWGI